MESIWDVAGLANIGSGAIVVIVVLSILRGWLVPRRVLKDCQEECRDWKHAALAKDDTISVMARQLDEAQEAARVATATMQALSRAAER